MTLAEKMSHTEQSMNNVDPHSIGRDFVAVATDMPWSRRRGRRTKRRLRTWHLFRRRGRSTTESERRDRKHLDDPKRSPSPPRGSHEDPRRCCSSSSSTPRLAKRNHHRDRSRLPHFTSTTVFIYHYYYYFILALYYQITATITTTTTTITTTAITTAPVLEKTCTRCPGKRWTIWTFRPGKVQRVIQREFSETLEKTQRLSQNYYIPFSL